MMLNSTIIRLSNIIFVRYEIYKYKMICRLFPEQMCDIGLERMLTYELKKQNSILELFGKLIEILKIYTNLSESV